MRTVLDVVSAVMLLVGVLLYLVAALGLVRLPDVFSRMHAATKASTLGLALVLLGAMLRVEQAGDAVRLGLVIAFTFLTAPVGAHMLGRAAYRSGVGGIEDLAVDELKDPDGPDPDGVERAGPGTDSDTDTDDQSGATHERGQRP